MSTPTLRDAARAVVEAATDLRIALWTTSPGSPDRDRMLTRFDAAIDALRAALAAPAPALDADDGRPPLPADVVAHDRAWLEGYTQGKRDYQPGGMYAAPAPPLDTDGEPVCIHPCGMSKRYHTDAHNYVGHQYEPPADGEARP